MAETSRKPFTGKHMAAILIAGFGVVMAVNFYMASLATGGFHGTVVDNSYVASQKFNDWLEEAEASKALGWTADAVRDAEGYVLVTTQSVPSGAQLTADLRRPIGEREFVSLTFTALDDGQFRSDDALPSGRWTMRLFIDAAGQKWAEESELK